MTKPRSRTEEDYLTDQMGRMAPCDLCIVTFPKSLFVQLSDEAAKRNMTFTQFMAAAIDSYLAPGSPPATLPQPTPEVVQESSNFEFISAPKVRATPPTAGTKRIRSFE
jgi:hypothetical protein